MNFLKALGLVSGGLDSSLAVKILLDQGIEVVALNFTSPFCTCNREGRCESAELAEKLKIQLIVKSKGDEFLEIVRKPKHGYGKNMNPCIDCRIFILKKAKEIAKEIGAKFIFTGEVLDQRPMSQHRKAMDLIAEEAGLKGKLLRPLSAKLLPPTEAEEKGWVEREKLLDIRGRQRKRQMALAENLNWVDYHCPGGGCLLTSKEFAAKVKDLFSHEKKLSLKDMNLLKAGRHFRLGKNKIVVGRNEADNKRLQALKKSDDLIFEVPDCGSPITLLQGKKTEKAVKAAAALTAHYSDAEGEKVEVHYGLAEGKLDRSLVVKPSAENVQRIG